MAEPTARDRQRLEALQERLAASREEKRAWAQERKELRARATAGERAAKRLDRLEEDLATERAKRTSTEQARAELEQRVAAVGEQQDDLVAENRNQAEQLEALRAESSQLQELAAEALRSQAAALEELKASQAARAELEERVRALEAETFKLNEALAAARGQLDADERPRVLPAEEVGGLVQSLVGQIRGSLPNLDLRDGEIRLQVAFASTGKVSGFVVPSADATEQLSGPLHELAFRFERSATS